LFRTAIGRSGGIGAATGSTSFTLADELAITPTRTGSSPEPAARRERRG
jgi:hypothetical protein